MWIVTHALSKLYTLHFLIIYLTADDLHNKDVKWEVAPFLRTLKVMVYEEYKHVYIYIYICMYVYKMLNEMSKKEILKFSNFFFFLVVSIIT